MFENDRNKFRILKTHNLEKFHPRIDMVIIMNFCLNLLTFDVFS